MQHDRQDGGHVRIFILDQIYSDLPTPPYTQEEKETLADGVYAHVWQRAVRGDFQSLKA